MIAILLILVFIAGCAKGVMDTLQFHFSNSIFPHESKYWDAEFSWENKYYTARTEEDVLKNGGQKYVRKKWFGLIPVPVLFTDGWHLFQSIFLTLIFIAMIFYQPIFYLPQLGNWYILADYIALRGSFGLGFVLFYNFILVKK